MDNDITLHITTALASVRVCTDIKTLFSRTSQGLQRPNSRVFQDSKKRFKDFPGYTPFTNMVA